jgi:hypothetical protein
MTEAMEGEVIAAAAGRPMTDAEVREALGGEEPGPEEPPPGCPHPPSERRLEDGVQVCRACGEAVEEWERQAIVPKDRPGTDPTMREETAGGLRHVTVPQPGDTGRPYTPDQIERELVVIIDRIERGAGWLTTQEERRAAAKLAYEIAYAKARYNSDGRSAEQRNDDALLQCLDLYEEWQGLELVCRTAREGLHNLRSMQSGLQSVARSIGTALGGYR